MAKVSRPLFLYRAKRALTVKRIGVLLECSGAERKQNDNLLIPYAHQGKSSDNLLDRSLDRALMHFCGGSSASEVLIDCADEVVAGLS